MARPTRRLAMTMLTMIMKVIKRGEDVLLSEGSPKIKKSSASNSPAKKIKPDPETAEHLESYEDIPDDSADPDYDDNVYIEGNEEDYNDQSGQGGPMIFEGEMPPPEVSKSLYLTKKTIFWSFFYA